MPNTPSRPSPEALLAYAQAEEQQQTRGKLKIFLGYVAGVGKTYAMLGAAHQRRAESIDVVVGYAETHGRVETEELLAGLEIIPRQQVAYRGVTLPEMDMDAVLARRPQLALVDELAHTNAPGSRHPKRYQDVEELLAAGIDVYTTLNIQHLESLNDVVAQITGVTVRETVPDRLLDEANEIELIDLPPAELLQRLEEGKVYVPDQAARAIQKFFRPGNLAALREMALRRAAERVDDQMRTYMQTRAIPGPWPAGDRLLVCVSPSPLSERLVRAGRRLADPLDAEWFAMYVETPGHAQLSEVERDRVARTLRLAEELGAKVVSLPGPNVAETVIDYARSHNITKIIAGKPLRSPWLSFFKDSLVDQLINQSGDIDVYIISSAAETPSAIVVPADLRPHRPWNRYLQSIGLVVLAALVGEVIDPVVSPANLVMLFLLAVVIASLRLGRGPAIVAAVFSVVGFNFFFVPPRYTFAVADPQYLITFGSLLIVGLAISTLASQVREQAEVARRRETQTATLYALSRDLASAVGLDEIMQAVITHIGQTFDREVAVFLPAGERLTAPGVSPGFGLDEDKLAVAAWAFQHGRPAGRHTDTLSAADARYLPLKTARGVVGVLGLKLARSGLDSTPEQRRLMEAFASQTALAIERANLAETARQAELLRQTEKLQTALLNSISHDLRTPLASITGSLSSLLEDEAALNPTIRQELLKTAHEEAGRLNQLVGNLLDMSRLEAGALKISYQPSDIQDVIGAALQRLDGLLAGREVRVDLPPDLPLLPLDFVLVVQALVNVLDNAVKYSPPDTPIEVRAQVSGHSLQLEIADHGPGLPPDDLTRIFDKFYRGPHTSPGVSSDRRKRGDAPPGTGLGLSISSGIIEAHGGRIWAENRPGGGLVIKLLLPLEEKG
ncbi:MAG: sensor histidine kinase KdpD [Anaerolineae bacterium]|nr:sensor histidine kinase KdpD [Anaerolineales bacterium]MCQ3976381.1 sensor histidine kinase KdpD [Anaerolineae bacterium]